MAIVLPSPAPPTNVLRSTRGVVRAIAVPFQTAVMEQIGNLVYSTAESVTLQVEPGRAARPSR